MNIASSMGELLIFFVGFRSSCHQRYNAIEFQLNIHRNHHSLLRLKQKTKITIKLEKQKQIVYQKKTSL